MINKIDTSPEAVERFTDVCFNQGFEDSYSEMELSECGSWVRFDDYIALSARIAALSARNEALGEAVAYATQRFTSAEANLARAVEGLGKISLRLELTPDEMQRIARATLAAIKETGNA